MAAFPALLIGKETRGMKKRVLAIMMVLLAATLLILLVMGRSIQAAAHDARNLAYTETDKNPGKNSGEGETRYPGKQKKGDNKASAA